MAMMIASAYSLIVDFVLPIFPLLRIDCRQNYDDHHNRTASFSNDTGHPAQKGAVGGSHGRLEFTLPNIFNDKYPGKSPNEGAYQRSEP
jgi:hypothetical protein